MKTYSKTAFTLLWAAFILLIMGPAAFLTVTQGGSDTAAGFYHAAATLAKICVLVGGIFLVISGLIFLFMGILYVKSVLLPRA